uniref:START domain-containing protein n=1 Tax=Acrobeloides nanus TaxID=290746 RepID=A0A914C8W9_9BILA
MKKLPFSKPNVILQDESFEIPAYITRQALGRNALIGGFYNAKKDIVCGSNLFTEQLPEKFLSSDIHNHKDVKEMVGDSFEEKFLNLEIEDELKTTKLNMDHIDGFLQQNINEIPSDATHVITGIEYGGIAIFTLTGDDNENDDMEHLKETLKSIEKNNPSSGIEMNENWKLHLYYDLSAMPKEIKDLDEAREFYHKFDIKIHAIPFFKINCEMGSFFSTGNTNTKRRNINSPIVRGYVEMDKLMKMQRNIAHQAETIDKFLKNFSANDGRPVKLDEVEKTSEMCTNLQENLTMLNEVLQFIHAKHGEKNKITDKEIKELEAQGKLPYNSETVIELNNAINNQFANLNINNTNGNEDPLMAEIQEITAEQLRYAKAGIDDSAWKLFCENGDLQVYSRRVDEGDSIACPPLKAMNTVQGVTAKEYIDIYFDPDLKTDWDTTVDSSQLVDTLKPNILIIHQIHKWVPPASQRESVIWTHMCDVSKYRDPNAFDAYMVCNHTIDRDDLPLAHPSNVRLKVKVAMLCQTFINRKQSGAKLTRNDVSCKITYVAQIHPGGLVPIVAMMQVYKREFPKFFRNFTKYVCEIVQDKPLKLEAPQENSPIACNF